MTPLDDSDPGHERLMCIVTPQRCMSFIQVSAGGCLHLATRPGQVLSATLQPPQALVAEGRTLRLWQLVQPEEADDSDLPAAALQPAHELTALPPATAALTLAASAADSAKVLVADANNRLYLLSDTSDRARLLAQAPAWTSTGSVSPSRIAALAWSVGDAALFLVDDRGQEHVFDVALHSLSPVDRPPASDADQWIAEPALRLRLSSMASSGVHVVWTTAKTDRVLCWTLSSNVSPASTPDPKSAMLRTPGHRHVPLDAVSLLKKYIR